MSNFTLWRTESKSFPKTVLLNNKQAPINSDFRVALKILKLYSDPNVMEIKKSKMMFGWFYSESLDNYKVTRQEALEVMVDYLAPPKEDSSDPTRKIIEERKKKQSEQGATKPPSYCFEYDAEEIYVSFIQDYKLDLVEINYLHWYKFLMMFSNLSKDTSFGRKVELRTMDLKDFKGKDKAKLMKAQKAIQIPVKLSTVETQMVEDLMVKLRS